MNKIIAIIKPEFFDIFGIFVFTFLIYVSIASLIKKEPLSKRISIILLLIGLVGIFVDGIIVYITYLK
jgi:energy-converting hydrogenase Eha subunit C